LFDFFEEDLTLDDKNKGIKDEKNGHISELGLFKGDTQQYSLSPTIQSMDEQGYEISRVRNISDTSKMDSNVSSNNENVGYIRNSDSSTAASTSRVGNFGNNSSRHNEIERDDRYGNTRDQHVNSTRSLFESGSGTIVTEVLGSDGERQKNERRIRGGRKSDKSILQNNSIAGQFQESSSTSNTGTWGARANEGERGSMGSEIRRDIRRTGERNRQEKHSGSIDKDSQAITKIDYKANLEVDFGNLKERFKKNIRAIQCLKSIEAENRFATRTEQAILNEFSGWGGLPQAFNPENTEWELEYQELKLTLTNDEYQRARNSTQDAFYTPKTIIDTIYKALDHLGFNDDNTKDIFEPSAGIGSFLTYAPENQNYHFTGVELDNISSRILKQLHQKQDIRKAGSFENVIFNRQYDAFIGNPPFGQKKILDVNDLNLNKLSVHNYFVGNSIKNLKNNGIAAFVISSYYLDSKNSSIRELIGNDATFLGAVRLPNNAFKKRANTEVTTDIIFYQKGFNQKYNKSCIKSQMYFKNNIEMMAKKLNLDEDTIKSFHINEYFIDHPENILGNLEMTYSPRINAEVSSINKSSLLL
ncbi:Eco57I restriction-modification methylase domain-containing protein, partial [Campylobacter fetus]